MSSMRLLTGTCYASIEQLRLALWLYGFRPVRIAETPCRQVRDGGVYTAKTGARKLRTVGIHFSTALEVFSAYQFRLRDEVENVGT